MIHACELRTFLSVSSKSTLASIRKVISDSYEHQLHHRMDRVDLEPADRLLGAGHLGIRRELVVASKAA